MFAYILGADVRFNLSADVAFIKYVCYNLADVCLLIKIKALMFATIKKR
jgi:hypothetical protein